LQCYADNTMPVLTMSQGMGHPDEEDFDPQIFEPNHPNDEECDETEMNLFVDDGRIELNEGIRLISGVLCQILFRSAQQDVLILLLPAPR